MLNRFRLWLIFSLLFSMFMLSMPVFAQDLAETPTAIVVQTVQIETSPLDSIFIAEGVAIFLLIVLYANHRHQTRRQQR